MAWIGDYLASCLRELSEISIDRWADGFLKLPQSVRYPVFISEESSWLIEPLRAIGDPKIRRVDIRGPVGSAKSLIGEIIIAWLIEHEPGPAYYVWQTDQDGVDAMEDRVLPMMEGNGFLLKRMPTNRHKKRMAKIVFGHMPLYIVGANPNAAQSKRIKWLIMEEPHLYKAGFMSAFEKRCEGVKNAKIITLSTGSVLDDESDKAFCDGSQEEWMVRCPHCQKYQKLTDSPERLKADRNDKTIDAQGNFIWSEFLKTVRYNCEYCNKDWPNSEIFRRTQSQDWQWQKMNQNARDDHRSFHFESAAIWWTPLATILEEKLKASYAAKRGSLEMLQEYVQKRRAMAWDESPPETSTSDIVRITGQFLKGDKWPDAISTFLLFDNQAGVTAKGEGEHRWYSCWSFGLTEMRLIDEGKVGTWEECEELRIKLGVEPIKTWVDCAYDTARVQAICCRYGWRGLWGDFTGKQSYPHHEMVKNTRVVRHMPFSTPQLGHVSNSGGLSRQAVYFWWCHQPIAQLYHSIKDGMTAYQMRIPQDASEDWKKHNSVEYKQRTVDSRGNTKWQWTRGKSGRADHQLDNGEMGIVAALMHPQLRQILYAFSDELSQAAIPAHPEKLEFEKV